MRTTITSKLLSDALRAGAADYQQAFGSLCERTDGKVSAICALGAIYLGAFNDIATRSLCALDELHKAGFPVNARLVPGDIPEEVTNTRVQTIGDLIVELNDTLHWSFAEIAEWLEQKGF